MERGILFPLFLVCMLLASIPLPLVMAVEKYTEFQLTPNNGGWYYHSNRDYSVKVGDAGYIVFWRDASTKQINYAFVGYDGLIGDVVSIPGIVDRPFHLDQCGDRVVLMVSEEGPDEIDYDNKWYYGILNNATKTISWTINGSYHVDNNQDPGVYGIHLIGNSTNALVYLYDAYSLLQGGESYVRGFFWLNLETGAFTRVLKTELVDTNYGIGVLHTVSPDGLVHFFLGESATDWNTYLYTISYNPSTDQWSSLEMVLTTNNASGNNFGISPDAQYLSYSDFNYNLHILKRGESGWSEYITPIYLKYSDNKNSQLGIGNNGTLYLGAWNYSSTTKYSLYVFEISGGTVVNTTAIIASRQNEPNNFFTKFDGIAFYGDYYGRPYGVLFDPFITSPEPEPEGNSTYIVNYPPFILESTTPFVTEHYQPDGVSYSNWTMDLYFEVVGGGNVTVWAPEGFPGVVKGITAWGPYFAYSAYVMQNPPLWDFANNTVTFYNIPAQGSYTFCIAFRYPHSGGGSENNTSVDEGEDESNSSLPSLDLGEAVNSALSALPEPLRAPVAFTLVGLPIILILLIITGGGATVKGAYRRRQR